MCSVIPRNQIAQFLLHLNSIEPSIQFTFEVNMIISLPFLDVLLTQYNGCVHTSVYRKPSHTDRYLDFTSHHPSIHKTAVVRTLFSRANVLSSSPVSLEKECTRICQALNGNNYPASFVSRSKIPKPSRQQSDEHDQKHSIALPYIRGLSEAIKRVFSEVDVRVVHHPHTTLRRELVHLKAPIPSMQKSGVVYYIPCSECSEVYIGQTERPLATRLKEHKAAVKFTKTDVSAVAEHIWHRQHQMDFQSATILAQDHDMHRRCFLESWHI